MPSRPAHEQREAGEPQDEPATAARGSGSPVATRSMIAIHRGTVAITRATTPLATRPSAHTTPPLPPTRSAPPTMAEALHCGRPRRMPSRRLRRNEIAKRMAPAMVNRVDAMRNGGRVLMAILMAT